jgi:hypothetical protein
LRRGYACAQSSGDIPAHPRTKRVSSTQPTYSCAHAEQTHRAPPRWAKRIVPTRSSASASREPAPILQTRERPRLSILLRAPKYPARQPPLKNRFPLSRESTTNGRSPEVSSTAFRAQPPDLQSAPFMDMGFAVICPFPQRRLPPIRFLSIGSRICSTLLSDPASRRRPCASLTLHLHQVG